MSMISHPGRPCTAILSASDFSSLLDALSRIMDDALVSASLSHDALFSSASSNLFSHDQIAESKGLAVNVPDSTRPSYSRDLASMQAFKSRNTMVSSQPYCMIAERRISCVGNTKT